MNKDEIKPLENDKPWLFKEGNPGGPGRPKGSVSILSGIKLYLEQHPEKLADLVQYYLTDEKQRDLLIKMIDGAPRQSTEISGGLSINIVDYKDEKEI